MTFNINQLEPLHYEEAESLLYDYIDNLIEQLATSVEGKIYLEKHDDLGWWISHLIEYGYQYEG